MAAKLASILLAISTHTAWAAPQHTHRPQPPPPRPSTKGGELPSLHLDTSATTLSGVSSGGYMAVQYQVSHSCEVSGTAVIAGGPFWCAMDDADVALSSCMKSPELIDLNAIWDGVEAARAVDSIDPTDCLKEHKIWLFSGSNDTEVHPGVVRKLGDFYRKYVQTEIVETYDVPAEHSWLTTLYNNPCDFLGSPFLNNCSFDAAGSMLNAVQANLTQQPAATVGNLTEFDQSHYIPLDLAPRDISMADKGFVYIPQACLPSAHNTGIANRTGLFAANKIPHSGGVNETVQHNQKNATLNDPRCTLHVSFHGCEQGVEFIGDLFARMSGLNQWAETNNIVVLYPQAIKTDPLPFNPKGCWDWWGYTGTDYATKLAPQIVAVKNMITALAN